MQTALAKERREIKMDKKKYENNDDAPDTRNWNDPMKKGESNERGQMSRQGNGFTYSYRWVGNKLLRFFKDILFARTNSNGPYRVDL